MSDLRALEIYSLRFQKENTSMLFFLIAFLIGGCDVSALGTASLWGFIVMLIFGIIHFASIIFFKIIKIHMKRLYFYTIVSTLSTAAFMYGYILIRKWTEQPDNVGILSFAAILMIVGYIPCHIKPKQREPILVEIKSSEFMKHGGRYV